MSAFALFLIIIELAVLIIMGGAMAGNIDRVIEEVTEIKGKVASMKGLLARIAALIRANVGNEAALLSIASDLDAESAGIQAALDANSDVDPGEPPPAA